jgi:hypothetical protein
LGPAQSFGVFATEDITWTGARNRNYIQIFH